MQSFSRGWSFLKQVWKMAFQDKDLIKPSVYALLAGLIVSLIFLLPMAGVTLFVDQSTTLGQVILVLLGAVMVFIQYIVSYIFSAMTVYLIFGYLAEGDGRMDKAWAIVRRDLWDLASLAAASTVVNVVKNMVKGKGRNAGRSLLAGLIDVAWSEAAFLILPAMVIEDINLKEGLKRAGNIIKNNLLLVGVSTVGVRAVNGLLGFLLGLFGIGLGFGAGYGIVSLSGVDNIGGWIGGISLGVVLAAIFIMAAAVITAYTATAYHTCLYLWARDVEKAQLSGHAGEVEAPVPLAAALQE